MEGREATIKVREYFLDVHGTLAVNDFRVQEVKRAQGGAGWVVKCLFKPSFYTTKILTYEVEISDEGQIKQVKELTR